ncbi:hypothetical protein A2U01_0064547, partial [Trifolium medium]|nr:hypothetical protein [Trifolium medium]
SVKITAEAKDTKVSTLEEACYSESKRWGNATVVQKVELAKRPAKERLAPIVEDTEAENGKYAENEDYMDDDDLLDEEPDFD